MWRWHPNRKNGHMNHKTIDRPAFAILAHNHVSTSSPRTTIVRKPSRPRTNGPPQHTTNGRSLNNEFKNAPLGASRSDTMASVNDEWVDELNATSQHHTAIVNNNYVANRKRNNKHTAKCKDTRNKFTITYANAMEQTIERQSSNRTQFRCKRPGRQKRNTSISRINPNKPLETKHG